ncbi:MAG: hypothetical protein P9X24_08565 [Candidatus Hatepunaea meridiana]|nr:hypothetical protein [Candidatus Hatepunaea meridiana]
MTNQINERLIISEEDQKRVQNLYCEILELMNERGLYPHHHSISACNGTDLNPEILSRKPNVEIRLEIDLELYK